MIRFFVISKFRVKTGASAALIMINKLQRRKRNTTGFLKTFFNDFWAYVLENGEQYGKFASLTVGSHDYNNLINAYDLIGKVRFFILPSRNFDHSHSQTWFSDSISKLIYSPVLVIFHVKIRKKSENYEHHGKLWASY